MTLISNTHEVKREKLVTIQFDVDHSRRDNVDYAIEDAVREWAGNLNLEVLRWSPASKVMRAPMTPDPEDWMKSVFHDTFTVEVVLPE